MPFALLFDSLLDRPDHVMEIRLHDF